MVESSQTLQKFEVENLAIAANSNTVFKAMDYQPEL